MLRWARVTRRWVAGLILVGVLRTAAVSRPRFISTTASRFARGLYRWRLPATAYFPPAAERLRELASRGGVCRQVLAERVANLSLSEIFTVADEASLVDLVVRASVAASAWDTEAPVALHQVIVLDQATAGPMRLAAALRVTSRIPQRIPTEVARAVLRRAIRIGEVPEDPYEPSVVRGDARMAAVALLAVNPRLDDEVVNTWDQTAEARERFALLAAALRTRSDGRADALAAALAAMRPAREDAITYGEAIDTTARLTPAMPHGGMASGANRAFRTLAYTILRLPLAWLAGPGAIAVGLLASRWNAWPIDLTVGWAEVFAALGAAVAANVLAAELAGNRLPGVLARRTAIPASMQATYSIIAALAFVVARDEENSLQLGWAGRALPAVIGLLIIALLFALWDLVRRTDPAAAATAFERSRRLAYILAGLQLGRAHHSASRAREAITGVGFARLTMTPVESQRQRAPIYARRRGVLVPSSRKISRLGERKLWREQRLTMVVSGVLGGVAGAGTEIGSVIPAPGIVVTRREYKRACRALAVRSLRKSEEVGEAGASLVGLIAEAGRLGDAGGAARVSQALENLFLVYLRAARFARREAHERRGDHAIAPGLRTMTERLLAQLSVSDDLESEALTATLDRLLHRLRPDELLIPMVTARSRDLSDLRAIPVLWECAARAVDTRLVDTRFVLDEVQRRLRASSDSAGQLRELAGRLAARAAWIGAPDARYLWNDAVQLRQIRELAPTIEALIALRVGGAALLSGATSLAIKVAIDMNGWGMDPGALEQTIRQRDVASREQALSDLYGAYLGRDAEAAMADFATFASRVITSLAP